MSKLQLSVAVGPYDRTRAAGRRLGPDRRRRCRLHDAVAGGNLLPRVPPGGFDICECSLSSFTVKTALGSSPYVGVPAFVSRMFRHTSIYARKDRIKKPEDFKGKRVGLPEYQLTANVWARAILEEDHGVKPSDVTWVRGGIDDADRPEKITLNLPKDVRLEDAPEGKTISALLDEGAIDGFIAPRPPAGAAFAESEYRLAVRRSDRRRERLLPAHQGFPDHASGRHPPHAGRAASLAADGGAQGLHRGQGEGAGAVARHLRHQGDDAVRRGEPESGARIDG